MDEKINEIKNLLKDEIIIIEDKNKFLDDSFFYLDMYKQMLMYIDIDNIDSLLDNSLYLDSLLSLIYDKKDKEYYYNKIYSLSLDIKMYQKLEYYEEDSDYLNKLISLKNIFNELLEDYNLLKDKNYLLTISKDNRDNKYYKYNRLLYSLNNNVKIADEDIIVIKELLEENNIENSDIKIFLENILIYNKKINKYF